MNQDLDLAVEKVIHAPVSTVWNAWVDPDLFSQWWIPKPYICRVEFFDPSSGGGFITNMSEDSSTYLPHMDAAFLLVESEKKIVFTNAVDSQLRPAHPQPVPVTGVVTFQRHPEGTLYRIVARHGDPAAHQRHQELGLFEGWTLVTQQLADLAEASSTA